MEKSKFHALWFKEAEKLAASVNVDLYKPRTAQRQMNRQNVPAEGVSQYYELNITLPFIDHLVSQIQNRFSDRNVAILNEFCASPAKVVSMRDWRQKFQLFLNEYKEDLPEARYINTELNISEEHWRRVEGVPPAYLSALLPSIDRISFPNIFTALKILATVPVTTCTCERSISALRCSKTYLRSTMNEHRLNGLALLHVHREIDLDVQQGIDRFTIRHPLTYTYS